MTTATVTPSKSGKPAKFRRDHKINWWLTAAVAVLSLTILIPLYFTIVTALKTPAEAGTFALPTSWQWHKSLLLPQEVLSVYRRAWISHILSHAVHLKQASCHF